MSPADRDRRTIFIVRALILSVVLAISAGLAIGGTAKLFAPGDEAGYLAADRAWPIGLLLTAWAVNIP